MKDATSLWASSETTDLQGAREGGAAVSGGQRWLAAAAFPEERRRFMEKNARKVEARASTRPLFLAHTQ